MAKGLGECSLSGNANMTEWSNWFWLAVLIFGMGCIALRYGRYWLLYYLWGAAGLTLILIYLALTLGWEMWLERVEIQHTQSVISTWIQTNALETNMLMVPDPTGWSLLRIGVECSAMIELSALFGLILFYPRFKIPRKLFTIMSGAIATYILNIVRLAVIVLMTHFIGKQAVIVAHTMVGRPLFFVGVIAIYWYLITKPTLTLISKDIRERM